MTIYIIYINQLSADTNINYTYYIHTSTVCISEQTQTHTLTIHIIYMNQRSADTNINYTYDIHTSTVCISEQTPAPNIVRHQRSIIEEKSTCLKKYTEHLQNRMIINRTPTWEKLCNLKEIGKHQVFFYFLFFLICRKQKNTTQKNSSKIERTPQNQSEHL